MVSLGHVVLPEILNTYNQTFAQKCIFTYIRIDLFKTGKIQMQIQTNRRINRTWNELGRWRCTGSAEKTTRCERDNAYKSMVPKRWSMRTHEVVRETQVK